MDFHIPEPGHEPGETSYVEVRFSVVEIERTRVDLTQSNWESFGGKSEWMRDGYDKGWAAIFESAYKAACGG